VAPTESFSSNPDPRGGAVMKSAAISILAAACLWTSAGPSLAGDPAAGEATFKKCKA
jgi:cytochrome c2